MRQAEILQELEALAQELDVEVCYEIFEGYGGLCRYGGRTRLIVNRHLGPAQQVRLFCQALSRLPLERVFIRPRLRELLEAHAAKAL
jgi:hypothetical protein